MGRRFAFIIVSVLSLALSISCTNRELCRQLNELETLVQAKPDSALQIIRSIDTLSLKSSGCRAKYSLLHAMALDKNYIDTTNLNILQPAIRRYTQRPHFNNLDKFFTWYYRGRIEENGKDYIPALQSFLQAEKYMNATDDIYRTRLYFSFERIYSRNYLRRQVYDAGKKALLYARKSNDTFNYSAALLDCATNSVTISSKKREAKEYLTEYDSIIGGENYVPQLANYYLAKTSFYANSFPANLDSCHFFLLKYLDLKQERINVIAVLRSAIACKDFNLAKQIIDKNPDSSTSYNEERAIFYYYSAMVHRHFGDYKNTLDNLNQYIEYLDRADIRSYNHQVASSEALFKEKLKRTRIALLSLSSVFLLTVLVLVMLLKYRHRKYQYSILYKDYESLQKEYQTFLPILNTNNLDGIKDRLLQFGLDAGKNYSSFDKSAKILSKTLGTHDFEHLLTILLATNCPNLYSKYVARNLTDSEIAVCCLLLFDTSEKEISYILDRKGIRNICSEIRKKLGFDTKTGYLSTALKSLYKST